MTFDAIVIGAGPAGCAASLLLGKLGHAVLLIDRGRGDQQRLAQSIPPSTRRTLAALDLLEAIDGAGFHPWEGNTVWWGGQEPRVERFPAGAAGWQVARHAFDRVLLEAAVGAGVTRWTGAVRDVHLPDPDTPHSGAAVTIERDGRMERIKFPYVVDATGRAGVVARRGLRQPETSHHTIALVGEWESDAWEPADDTHTLVASYVDGWAWSVAVSPRTRHVTVMVDPSRTALARGSSALDVYRAELEKVAPFAPALSRARLTHAPWGSDASLYSAARYAGPGFLLAGDAGSFIDPLSSFGVRKALASGWLAAVAIHTALIHPSMTADALAFHDRRERAVSASYRRLAADFAADAAAGTRHPYWMARADPPEGEVAGEAEEALADPSVRPAYEELRRRPALRVLVSEGAVVERRPAIDGHEIVHREHLVLPDWPDGVRYLRGVDVLDLLRRAPHHDDAGALYEACRGSAPSSLPDFLAVLSWLLARGVLVHRTQ